MDTSLPKKIWLAGLGAIARAEREGDVWLEELMAEGETFEREKKDDIDNALQEMTERVKGSRNRVKQRFDSIESTFETKVSKLLHKVGLASADELGILQSRLDALEKQLTAAKSTKNSAPKKAAATKPRSKTQANTTAKANKIPKASNAKKAAP
ncbi:phasin family protein [Reinekea sp. G2M2-21]|uniref:phasin family protein n=1 Tax=Reinekea sp. G2M2-21 TaxID=2788942 RepID=UPI0018AC1F39|nr:phasin family protein [Reinekea sp. G2M2-21]